MNAEEAWDVATTPLAAATYCPALATVGVTAIESTSPLVEIVADTDPAHAVDVSVTVPVKDVTRLLFASRADTRTLNAVPATLFAAESAVVPPDMVTPKAASGPGVKVTVAVSVMDKLLSVALTVALPTVLGAVRLAVYCPLPA